MRIGPRMRELLRIIHRHFGGRAPSRSAAYMRLGYGPGGTGSSNAYGDAVMRRLEKHGLVRCEDGEGNRIAVALTDTGREAIT